MSDKPKSHRHKPAGCPEYADWQAGMQVELAAQIVLAGRTGDFRRDDTVFGQVVRIVAGQQADFLTKDGIPNRQPFTNRLRAAIERYRAEVPPDIMEVSDANS